MLKDIALPFLIPLLSQFRQGDQSSISVRELSCACSSCLSGDYVSCKRIDQFKDVIDMITFKKHVFQVGGKKKRKAATDEDKKTDDLNYDEIEE